MPIIVACPSCNGQLRVADDLIGRKVRCPACNTTFDAESPPVPAADLPEDPDPAPAWNNLNLELSSDPTDGPGNGLLPPARNGPSVPIGAVEIDMGRNEPAAGPPAPDEYPLQRDQRRPRRRDDDEQSCPACGEHMHANDTRCPACGERVPEKRRRRSRRDDDDDDYPRRRPMRRDWEPHRGGMILTFGIISAASITFAMCYGLTTPIGIGFGLAAWIMGSRDLKKIRAGMMDPEGEGNTQAGWICGIIGVCLNTVAMLACGGFIWFIFYMQAETAKQFRNAPNMGPPPAKKRPF